MGSRVRMDVKCIYVKFVLPGSRCCWSWWPCRHRCRRAPRPSYCRALRTWCWSWCRPRCSWRRSSRGHSSGWAVAGSDALADVLLPQEAPQRAQPPLLYHRVDVASSVRMQVADSHPSSHSTHAAIACASSQSQSQSTSIKAHKGQKKHNTRPNLENQHDHWSKDHDSV